MPSNISRSQSDTYTIQIEMNLPKAWRHSFWLNNPWKFTPSNQILSDREDWRVWAADECFTTTKTSLEEGQIDADSMNAHYLRHAGRWDLSSGSGNTTISVCVIAAVSPDTYRAQQFNHTSWEHRGFPKVNLPVQLNLFFYVIYGEKGQKDQTAATNML